MLITSLFPWVLINTAIILYHLISGDFTVNYERGHSPNVTPEQISIGKYIVISYPIWVFVGVVFTLMLWLPFALSLWLWSKVRNMQITFYVNDDKEI